MQLCDGLQPLQPSIFSKLSPLKHPTYYNSINLVGGYLEQTTAHVQTPDTIMLDEATLQPQPRRPSYLNMGLTAEINEVSLI